MNMNDKIELHKKLLDNMHELYIKKNSDYGDSVHDTYKKYGLVSFLVRIEDKLNRVKTLNEKSCKQDDAKVLDEKIEDTLMDLANYSILALIELKNDKSELCQSADEVKVDPSNVGRINTPINPLGVPFSPNDYPFSPTVTFDSTKGSKPVFNYESEEYKKFLEKDKNFRKNFMEGNSND